MKKGFTLVELLAVIILIGVITLMTTTVIGNKIDDSKMKVLYNNTIRIKKLVEDDCSEKAADGITVKDYPVADNHIGDIEVTNEVPETLEITSLDDECNFKIYAKQGNYCAYSLPTNNDILVGKFTNGMCNDKDGNLIIEED